MSGQHAPFAPSAMARKFDCHGSHRAEQNMPDDDNADAALGTLAHTLAAHVLTHPGTICEKFVGLCPGIELPDVWTSPVHEAELRVDEEMVEHVQEYVDTVRKLADGHTLLVEQRLRILPDVWGTGDVIILRADGEALDIDLKYGVGVRVNAHKNKQLMTYAVGVLEQYDGLEGPIDRVRGMIYQPRNGGWSEDVWTRAELFAFKEELRALVAACIRPDAKVIPGSPQCTFCKYKPHCAALREEVYKATGVQEFGSTVPAALLGEAMDRVELVEKWAKAVRGEVERRLLAGEGVPGYKLVKGRAPATAWADDALAESELKAIAAALGVSVDEMYEPREILSPTKVKTKFKKKAPHAWKTAQALIAPKRDGAPSVAHADDKRPALNLRPTAEGFSVVNSNTQKGNS